MATADVLDSLDRLVDAGLITFVEADGAARYRMLETVRDFAAAQLDEHDRGQLGLSHAMYYSTIAARIGALRFDDHETSVRLGDQELGNLRAAMTWAFTNLQARLGMSIASDLWRYFWEQASGGNENVRWGRTALELIDEDDDGVLLVAAGTVIEAYNLGDRDAEAYAARRVRRGLGAVNDPVVKSRLLVALGTSVMDSDPRAAEAFLDEAWSTAPLRPRSIDILNNYIELSWLVGTLDGATIHERLDEVLQAPLRAAADGCEDRGRRRRVRRTLGRSHAPDRNRHRIRQIADRHPSAAQRGARRTRPLRRRSRPGPTTVRGRLPDRHPTRPSGLRHDRSREGTQVRRSSGSSRSTT